MTTATKENISLVKEVFNGRPLDYSVMSCYDIWNPKIMWYEILKSDRFWQSVRTYAEIFF